MFKWMFRLLQVAVSKGDVVYVRPEDGGRILYVDIRRFMKRLRSTGPTKPICLYNSTCGTARWKITLVPIGN